MKKGLLGPRDPRVETLGRNPDRITNQRLEALLSSVFELSLADVYATNVFPFVKPGAMSASIPQALVYSSARTFTAVELVIAKPKLVLALGKVAQRAMHEIGRPCLNLPHPAARRLDLLGHEQAWRNALSKATLQGE